MVQYFDLNFLVCTLAALVFFYKAIFFDRAERITVINLCFMFLVFFYFRKHIVVLTLWICLAYAMHKYLAHLNARIKNIHLFFALLLAFTPMIFYRYEIARRLFLSLVHLPYLGPYQFFGISFLSFRMTHVFLRSSAKIKLRASEFLAYLLFFPTFLSGPLDSTERFLADLRGKKAVVNWQVFLSRIIRGLFKKLVLANPLEPFTLQALNSHDLTTLPTYKILLSLYLYSFVLYFDFSGYCDIAIGIAGLFGFQVPENFNKPYLSRNIQDFWNRWHITFMAWLREFLFFPLSKALYKIGSKNTLLNTIVSFTFVFILAGAWHGDGWNYLHYGLYHGIGMVIFVLYRQLLKAKASADWLDWYDANQRIRFLAIFITLNYVSWSWFFFLDKEEFLWHIIRLW